ncbi:hypothetical protein ABEB36_005650 [Hypothenemus hampei]|uniref:V-type proton ATPase subunit a n=1 Tax=Hypothenemus hampei TaxID=57062 RepID=A0ABD1F1L7_HYPHA
MGALFRGEEMTLLQFFLQPEAAYHIIAELGERGCVQFRDLNEDMNLYQREYANEVKRINEMERQLRYIEGEIKKGDIRIQDISTLPKAPNPKEIVNFEAHLEKTERDIREISEGGLTLKKEYYDRILQKNVLMKAQMFFNQHDEAIQHDYCPEELTKSSPLGFIGGVVDKVKQQGFERILWRIGHGNIFIRCTDIEESIIDPANNSETRKAAFIAFFQGENLANKIKRVCDAYKVTMVDVPVEKPNRDAEIKRLSLQLQDIKTVLQKTEEHRQRLLEAVAKEIQNWSIMVCKMKAIYYTLNLFSHDVSRKLLIAEGWVPKGDLPHIDRALSQGSTACGSSVASFYNTMVIKQTPPTFNRTNRFTQGFQNLIEVYACSSYRELNPTLYTIITFPFLFAIMFGDLGHGLIMALFGLWMVLSEKKIIAQKEKNEIFSLFFGGRYIILLMGIFSMYTGFIYNDLFSKSMNIFGTQWRINVSDIEGTINYNTNESNEAAYVTLKPLNSYKGSSYFAGIDPVWQTAENKIIFLNNFKMKLSLIFGVVHMIFGICLSTINFRYLKKSSHIFLDFVPKILFFGFLFVYLVTMIFIKWINYTAMNDDKIGTIKTATKNSLFNIVYYT